jgi:hypothetical protein
MTALVLALGVASCSSPGPYATSNAGGDASHDATTVVDDGPPCITCGDATQDLPPVLRVKEEIDQVCSSVDGCHGAGAGNLALSFGNEFATMINVRSYEVPTMYRVLPFHPEQSYVYLKLACDAGIDGGCMPLGSKLDPQLVQVFHDWIEAGAPTM